MDIFPQLEFNGECEAAFEHYARLFGGTITIMNKLGRTKDVPLPPGSTGGKAEMVRFAELQIGETKIRGNDLPAGEYHSPRGFNMSVYLEKTDEARRIFRGLSEGGTVSVEPAKVAWADFFATVTDRFGIAWLVLGLEE
jgi:PhnB protein